MIFRFLMAIAFVLILVTQAIPLFRGESWGASDWIVSVIALIGLIATAFFWTRISREAPTESEPETRTRR